MIDPNDPGTLDLVAACEEPLSGAERARRHRLKKKREKEAGQRAALDLKAPELALLGVALGEFRERWQRVPSKLQAVEALLPRIPVPDLAQVFPGDSAWLPDAAQQLGVYPNYVAHSVANVEFCKSHSPLMFRQTPHGQPEVDALLTVGDVVWTSYGTGPYRVKCVTRHEWRGLRQFSLVLNDTDGRKGDSYINELVAVDGRLLKLFANNQDEVFVDKQPEHPEQPNEWQVRAQAAEAELAYLRAELQQIGGAVAAPAPVVVSSAGKPLDMGGLQREVAFLVRELNTATTEVDRLTPLEKENHLLEAERNKAFAANRTLTERLRRAGLPTDYRPQSGE